MFPGIFGRKQCCTEMCFRPKKYYCVTVDIGEWFCHLFSKDLIISVVTGREHAVDGDFGNQLATFDNHTKTFQISN